MDVGYREARLCDAAEIADIMSRYIDCPWSEAQVREEIQNADAPFFVAEADGHVVGFLSGVCAADECELSDVAVTAEYRRRGVATTLFSLLFDSLSARKVSAVFLLVRKDNAAAVRLYEKLGFCKVGERQNYYGNADAVIMRRQL